MSVNCMGCECHFSSIPVGDDPSVFASRHASRGTWVRTGGSFELYGRMGMKFHSECLRGDTAIKTTFNANIDKQSRIFSSVIGFPVWFTQLILRN